MAFLRYGLVFFIQFNFLMNGPSRVEAQNPDASIGNFVWEDMNGNGIQNPGEPGIAGVEVTLTGQTDGGANVSLTTLTDGAGNYIFDGLEPGNYILNFKKPVGYQFAVKDIGGDDSTDSDVNSATGLTPAIVLSDGEFRMDIDAGFYRPASIGDFVWRDSDLDGIQDFAEPGMSGITVTLTGTSGTGSAVLLNATTSASGIYNFSGLQPGTYKLTFSNPAGFSASPANVGADDTKDSDINTPTLSTPNEVLVSGETNNTYDAAFQQGGIIGDYVWEDLDGDGRQDPGEYSIPGLPITLTGTTQSGQGVTLTTNSTVPGDYLFTGLEPGTYKVSFFKLTNAVATLRDQGSDALDSDIDPVTFTTPDVILGPGASNLNIDAGFYFPGSIGNRVWKDVDGDGIQDNTETEGVPGVTVKLVKVNTQPPLTLTTTTDQNGLYQFSGLAPGSYYVNFTPPPGFRLSPFNVGTDDALDSDPVPGSNNTAIEILNSFEQVITVDAGMRLVVDLNMAVTNTDCDKAEGAIDLTVSGGTPPYTYLWSNGATTEDVSGLISAFYSVTVTDANGLTDGAFATVQSKSGPFVVPTITGPSCFGGNNGCITLSVTGGNAPLTYLWSTGATTKDHCFGIMAGTYTVTIIDAKGCIVQPAGFQVSQPPQIDISLTPTNATCFGAADGAISSVVNGGVAPYTYLWSNTHTTANIGGLFAGTYRVTVTDANGCTKTSSATVTQPSPIAGNHSYVNADCGVSNGIITMSSLGGGTPPYTYLWSNGETTKDISGLAAGNYTLTITDALGCTGIYVAGVFDGSGNIIILYSVTPPLCGVSNGGINLTVSGGTGPYNYLWSNNAVTEDLNGVPAGVYTVTVTASDGCTKTTSVTLSATNGPVITGQTTNIFCNGAATGGINISVSGGTPGYIYAWSNGAATQDLTGIVAGQYAVTVTDQTGCFSTATFGVSQPAALTLTTKITQSVCNQPNGSIDLSVTGGVPPYTYGWSNGSTPQDLNNLAAGSYTVTVTDANGCTKTASALVISILGPQVNFSVTPVSCFGGSDGAVDPIITGGTSPFTFLWSNSSTVKKLAGLSAGTYTVTVTDANGCTAKGSATVNQSASALQIDGTAVNTACGNFDGSINLSATGGTPPYTYDWSNGAITEDLNNIAAGVYTVTVADALNCTQTRSFAVQNSDGPVLSTTPQHLLCFGGNNGAIDLAVTAGTPNYTYLWSTGATTEDLNNLAAGPYSVTVTDANGCISLKQETILQPSGIALTGATTSPSCTGGNNGTIDLTVSGGTSPYTYDWSNNATSQDLTGLVAGLYTVTVTDVNGCTKTSTFAVTQSSPISIPSAAIVLKNVSCNGGADGSISVTPSGGVQPYLYNWSNGGNTQQISGLPAGAYTVTVTDANGCTLAGQPMTLTQPAPIILVTNLQVVACGAVSVEAIVNSGGIPAFVFDWSNGVTGQSNYFTQSGTYTVTVIDATGCSAAKAVPVTAFPDPNCATIQGRVVCDENQNCSNDGEPGLEGLIVRATGNQDFYAVTRPDGTYEMRAAPGDTYVVEPVLPNTLWKSCGPSGAVPVNFAGQIVQASELLVKKIILCPALNVDISSGNIRPCFTNNKYTIKTCNKGTATATGAFVVVTLDAFMTPVSSSIPYTDLGNNTLRFELGNLAVGQCKSFNLFVKLSCSAVVGQTHCTEAHAYPDLDCTPPNAQWSGASLELTSACASDSLRFRIRNKGFGPMDGPLEYIVAEDHVMLRKAEIKLSPSESMIVAVPANGSTWYMAIPQEPDHPGKSKPSLSVEGCTSGGSFSTGFVNQFAQNDEDDFIDIDCKASTAAYDPNDKTGYPLGYGPQHFIPPGRDIEYRIRFQNTGTDTAFNIRIVDTLSQHFDPATIRPGASSSPYTFNLYGRGIVEFLFENIMLPDSNVNEPESHGFVDFTIAPRSESPLGTVLENKAEIYFDFNPPIVTNTTVHRLGENFIVSGLWQPERPQYKVDVSPNPFSDEAILEIKGLAVSKNLRLVVYALDGTPVNTQTTDEAFFLLRREALPEGAYFYEIRQNGQLIGRGKLIAREK